MPEKNMLLYWITNNLGFAHLYHWNKYLKIIASETSVWCGCLGSPPQQQENNSNHGLSMTSN